MYENKHVVIIEGATGIGKTATGIELAKYFHTGIVSADSRQIYRELNIGTAKPTQAEQSAAKHHMIDIVSVDACYNAFLYAEQATTCLENIFATKDVAIVVGGSGLYINALSDGIDDIPDIDPQIRQEVNELHTRQGIVRLRQEVKNTDPVYYATVDLSNHARLIRAMEVFRQTGMPYSSFRGQQKKEAPWGIVKICLQRDREDLYNRINQRVDQMVSSGLEAEAWALVGKRELQALQTVGYKEFFAYFDGNITREEAIAQVKQNTRRYAKKQLSWFKRDESTTWIQADDLQGIINTINERIKTK